MKYFGLAAVALVMTMGASAATISETCTGVASPLGNPVISPTTLACADFSALPAGDTATSLQILAVDSFDGGTFGQTNVFDINYTAILAAITGLPGGGTPNGCVPGVGGGNTCTDVISGSLSGSSGVNPYDFGNAITTGLATYIGGGFFNVANVTSGVDPSSALNPLASNGDITTQIYATLTYSVPQTGTPEPGSMMLLGSGLLAAGLIGRKKLVRK
jgi:hypothetical protein